jgi:hypothetical protein
VGTYRRKGHYRRGRNGQMHWVSPHTVTRGASTGRRTSARSTSYSTAWFSQSSRPAPPRPVPMRYPALPYSARWLKPNAYCPVCSAAVYFWSNATGSRVYFDEMGPPWPKHPCTDARAITGAFSFQPRSPYASRATSGIKAHAGEFRRQFAVSPAQAYELEDVVWNGDVWVLHCRRVGWLRWRTVFVVHFSFPWVPGQLVFVSQGRLSTLNLATLEVLDFPAVTANSAARLLR